MNDILLQQGDQRIDCVVDGLKLTFTDSADPKAHYTLTLRDEKAYTALKSRLRELCDRYDFDAAWREIPGYPGNEASTFGGLRTYWYKVRNSTGYGTHRELRDTPRPIPMSQKEDGYLHVNIYCEPENRRHTRNVQTLVAHTFIPLPDDHEYVEYTVDHIVPGDESKRDNSVWNLQWLTRADNIRKAYREGMCDSRIQRQCKSVMIKDMWTDEWTFYSSIKDAARDLGLTHSTLSHAVSDGRHKVSHYIIEYADREDKLLYAPEYYEDGYFY